MKTLFSYLAAAIFLPLAGCIDQISVDLPAPPRQLVVNSILTPDSVFRVQVSHVTSATDSAARLLSSAQVYLRAPGRATELLRPQGRGLYYSLNKPDVKSAYTIEVMAAGYPAVSATDTVPERVPIREAWYSFPTGTDRNNELLGTVVLQFDDPGREVNFYEISCYDDFPSTTDIPLDARGNAALVAEDDAGFNPPSLVFSDKLFNGQAFELRASFRPNNGGTTNGIPTTRDPRIVLRAVSRAYYQYRKSWVRHLYNQGTKGDTYDWNQLLFLGDPITMYSNVAGGYGVLASYSQQSTLLRPR